MGIRHAHSAHIYIQAKHPYTLSNKYQKIVIFISITKLNMSSKGEEGEGAFPRLMLTFTGSTGPTPRQNGTLAFVLVRVSIAVKRHHDL